MNTETQTQTISANKMVQSDCYAIAFHRPTGSAPFQVNSFPVPDGGTYSIGQNIGDVDRTQYSIRFTGGGTKNCVVTRVFPVNDGLVSGNLL